MFHAACLLGFSPYSAHVVMLCHALINVPKTQHCLLSAACCPDGLSTRKGCGRLSILAHDDTNLSPGNGGCGSSYPTQSKPLVICSAALLTCPLAVVVSAM